MADWEIAPGVWVRGDARIPPGFIHIKDGDRLVKVVSIVDLLQKKPSEIYDELVAKLDASGAVATAEEFDIIAARAFHLDREVVWALERGNEDRLKEYEPKAEAAYVTMGRFYRRAIGEPEVVERDHCPHRDEGYCVKCVQLDWNPR